MLGDPVDDGAADNDRLGIKVRCDAADAADPDIVVPDFAAAGNQFFRVEAVTTP